MNKHTAELLEKHFDTAFAAPDGIRKLRELILTLAMQGKLVPQDPNDQPASELLKEIEAEKQRLVKEGKIKKPKPLPPITDAEKPYALPRGWEWVRLGDIGLINPRNNADDDMLAGFVPMPLIQEGYSEFHSFEERHWGDIRKGYTHFADGDVGMAKITPCFENAKSCVFSNLPSGIGAGTTELHIFRNTFDAVDPRYLLFFLKNPKFISTTAARMTGSAGQKRVPTPLFAELELPLPPISEQHHIVAKIDELMARCDELEKLRSAQQKARLTVHTAAIKQLLNIAEPDQHQHAQTFLAEHFGELYTVKENVAELRKAILQLAVMGKLVPQNPDDQPASALLQEIEAEKQRLVKEGKIKKPKPLPPVTEQEKPYALPQGWEWVRFFAPNTVKSELVSAGDCPDENQIAPDSIEKGTGRLLVHRTVAESGATGPNNRFYEGQILYSKIRPSLNKVVVAPYDGLCSADMYPIVCHAHTDFMLKVILSETFLAQVRLAENRVKMPKLNLESLGQFLIPLPPLAEQHDIVACIDQLMNLCDSLDQQIDAATCKQAELLSALIRAQSQSNSAARLQSESLSIAQVIDLAAYRTSIGCYAISKLANAQYFGRTAAAKVMYLAQAHVGLELNLKPERKAAGPLDPWIYDFEREGHGKRWFEVNEKPLANGRKKTEYRCLSALSEPAAKAESLMSSGQKAEFDRLIYALADRKTEEVEIIATLFAVWNDFLIDGIQPTDEQIITDMRENWHERKGRFSPSDLKQWLSWLRKENFVPRGLPPRTIQQQRLGV
ncbi:restriction endonuclease subunit S [Pusillimonas noertemannii]|uniref:restriction endonuclease subunit S n=1 Tax=Pusillimonas noertemannii TaxID=305977 RepID=UPI000316719D|nr:restriction endonuclease subunit S [Pusillimonas noertemannii]